MKIVTHIIFTFLLLTTAFSAFAAEEETDTKQTDQNITGGLCSPQPQCNPNNSISTLEQWIDKLEMQKLMELLKIQQDPSTQAAETNDG